MKGAKRDPIDTWFMLTAIRIITGKGPMPVLRPAGEQRKETGAPRPVSGEEQT